MSERLDKLLTSLAMAICEPGTNAETQRVANLHACGHVHAVKCRYWKSKELSRGIGPKDEFYSNCWEAEVLPGSGTEQQAGASGGRGSNAGGVITEQGASASDQAAGGAPARCHVSYAGRTMRDETFGNDIGVAEDVSSEDACVSACLEASGCRSAAFVAKASKCATRPTLCTCTLCTCVDRPGWCDCVQGCVLLTIHWPCPHLAASLPG